MSFKKVAIYRKDKKEEGERTQGITRERLDVIIGTFSNNQSTIELLLTFIGVFSLNFNVSI